MAYNTVKNMIHLLTTPFKKSKQQRKAQVLQSQFDDAVKEVEALMAKGDIKASGEALLKAEAIRKHIAELNQDKT